MRGRFITLEGTEGSGKSTQSARLAARLRNAGYTVITTREPGGTPTGEAIRDILQHDHAGEPICDETEALLFAASRAQHVRHVILPALERGDWVICDRFVDSSIAYQGYGRGLKVDDVVAVNALAIGAAVPDLTILFDLDVAEGFTRLEKRQDEKGQSPDRIEQEAAAFHQRVRNGYLALAERFSDRYRRIDASPDPDIVEKAVWDLVGPLVKS